jgi:hypothetical protein
MSCESYVYNRDVFTNTITMDLDLVCEDGDYKQRLLGTLVTYNFIFRRSRMSSTIKVNFW